MQALGLTKDRARVLQQRATGLRWRDTLAAARNQGNAKRVLHIANAGRSCRQGQMRTLGAMGDAASLDDMAK